MMQPKALKKILLSLLLIIAIVGTVLYIAAYFWGIFLMAASIAGFIGVKYFFQGKEEALGWARRLLKNVAIPVAGIVLSIILGAVIMVITGYNPLEAYKALFYGGFVRNWSVSILNAVPLIFTGLSVAFAFKAGLFNIGAEGQYYIGTMMATWLGLRLGLPPLFVFVLVFLISGLASAAYNIIPATLKVKTGAHEVITTMMLAHVARYLSPIFIRSNGGDPASSSHPYVTDTLPEANWLPVFKSFLPEANYRLHIGILIAIAVAFLVYYVLYYTRWGFEIRAVGQNPSAAKAQGISIGVNIMRALLVAGFLSGLAGANQVLGLDHKMFENLNANYGWNGISVAILASNHPIGVIFTGLLWGALDSGGQYMARTTQIPNSIVEIIKGTILFLVVARYIYFYFGKKWKKRREGRLKKEAIHG